METTTKPTYQPLKHDGAPFHCSDCGADKHASLFWFITTPNGFRGIICKDCVIDDWIKVAEFIDKPM